MSIQFHFNIDKKVDKDLRNFLNGVMRDMRKLGPKGRAEVTSIINRGIMNNHRILANGGTVREAGRGAGFARHWPMGRHPLTMAVRESMGLGATPLLKLTGRLQNNLAQGGTVVTVAGSMRWKPRASNLALIEKHEFGGRPFLGRTPIQKMFHDHVTIPPRPSIFWSIQMAEQVREVYLRKIQRINSSGVTGV